MTTNVGSLDRTLRIVAGVVLLSLLFLLPGGWNWLGLIGIVPLATAFLRWCPAYTLIGVSTCEAPTKKA